MQCILFILRIYLINNSFYHLDVYRLVGGHFFAYNDNLKNVLERRMYVFRKGCDDFILILMNYYDTQFALAEYLTRIFFV